MGSPLSRRLALLVALAAAGCAGRQDEGGSAETFEPLTFDYLAPIRLNVLTIEVEQRPGADEDATQIAPARPAEAIARMARDRLQALGTAGRAVLVITEAFLARRGGSDEGSVAVQLDIYTSSNVRAAFVEARVSARRSPQPGESRRRALYETTKQLLDQLNVEFEFQVRRALRDWLVEVPASAPGPVQEQALPPPAR